MIARLRKKFILITMLSLILVLLVLMGIVNTANYLKMDQSAGELLQVLSENGGTFPESFKDQGGKAPDTADSSAGADSAPVSGGQPSAVRRAFSPETPYEIRYFSVELGGDGSPVSVNTGKIAAISTEEAVSIAQKLQDKGKTSGYSGKYKYQAKQTNAGTLYVFLDCTRDIDSVKNFLSISGLVSLLGVLAVLLLVTALSRRAVRPVAESYDKQKKFITNAGHEIKTPLAIIDSCSEVLELETGENKWTQGIRTQVSRLNELTNSLVSLARMDEGGAELEMKEFSLSDAVRDATEPFVLLAENSGLHMSLDIQPDIRCTGSEQALRQLCSILADNAVKYALCGSEIKFSLMKRGRRILLVSENAAEGLEKGDQSVLFDRFYRGDMSRSSEKSGYGIGLSMAKSIVAAHGGRLLARCEDGKTLVITAQI